MTENVERTSFDLRYQGFRLRNHATETRLLADVAERGVLQPLAGVETDDGRLLLDGFKRYRCAARLQIECLPYEALGPDEAAAIGQLMQAGRQKPLNILEQARFVVELLGRHSMTAADVAQMLSRSKAWVSVRQNLMKEISPALQEMMFQGRFPVYSYMTTLRPFMRINGVDRKELQRFVEAVAGQPLSLREIELLAHGYFRGPAALRQAVDDGKWKWSLEQMQNVPADPDDCSPAERTLLRDLERLAKLMQEVLTRCDSPRLASRAFHAQANLLVAGLLARQELFFNKLEEFHDRSGNVSGDLPVTRSGHVAAGDQPPLASQPPGGAEDHPPPRPTVRPATPRQDSR